MGAVLQEQYPVHTSPEIKMSVRVVFSPAAPSLVFIHYGNIPKQYDIEELFLSLEHSRVLPDKNVQLSYHGTTPIEKIVLSEAEYGYIYNTVTKRRSELAQAAEKPQTAVGTTSEAKPAKGGFFGFLNRALRG